MPMTGRSGRRCGFVAAVAVALGCLLQPVSAQVADRAALVDSLDALATRYSENPLVPGIAVAVVRGGEVLLQKGYGFADLEWKVAMPAGASFEIGSITKQFTAAAVMLLVEDGKLDLDDDLTEYVDFDTQGHRLPLRRLLDHTSGIKGYTEMDVFGEFMAQKLPRDSLVRRIEQEPFQFAPGGALVYNNSAYFLLGLVIEKAAGVSYEDFVAERLFGPAGMGSSYYCSEAEIRENRAHGYDAAGPQKLIRKRYLDHLWPYAAGSLCSTVGDLVRWNQALHGGEILGAESYQAMITPMPLNDGTPTRYAMGLGIGRRGDSKSITHGGGINGFVSDGRYYPDDDLIVVALQNSNSTGAPIGQLGAALAEAVLGPAPEFVAATYGGDLEEFFGTYSGESRGPRMTVVVGAGEDGGLALEVSNGRTHAPGYRDGLTWVEGGFEFTFVREGGAITTLRLDHGGGHYVLKRE